MSNKRVLVKFRRCYQAASIVTVVKRALLSIFKSSQKSYAIEGKKLVIFTAASVAAIFALVFLLVSTPSSFLFRGSGSSGDGLSLGAGEAIKNALGAIPVLPDLKEPMNILVLGVDWNGDDLDGFTGTRSDTIMLVNVDPERHKVAVVSIPRDSRVEIARGHGTNKINSAHAMGGPQLTCQTVARNFGVDIDHYLVVDTRGLTKIFELLGPFEVVVEKEMRYKDATAQLDIDLKPGKQLLDPAQTIGYLRFRHDATADIGRMERQQWFLRQALEKARDPRILVRAPQIIKAAFDCVDTDLSAEEVASLLSFARQLDSKDVLTATLPGQGETVDGVNYLVLDDAGSRAIIARYITHSDKDPLQKRRHRGLSRGLSQDPETLKRRMRIAIKCSESMHDYAEDLTASLREKGWRVRYLIKAGHEDCQHAQLNLNTTRITRPMLASLEEDLPLIKDWPVVVKYGATAGSDVVLVLPDRGGISRWYEKDAQSAFVDVPNSRSLADAAALTVL